MLYLAPSGHQCVHDYDGDDDGPPDCLKNCGQGFETLSENSTDEEFCAVLAAANTTGYGCSVEELSDIECFSYMCGGLELAGPVSISVYDVT